MKSGGSATTSFRLRRISSHHSNRGQSGVSIVEFVIAISMVLFLMLAIFELGYAFFGRAAVSRMAHSGARIAGAQGKSGQADLLTLQAIAKDTAVDLHRVVGVEIYWVDPTNPNAGPPSGCYTNVNLDGPGVTNKCNYYTSTTVQGILAPSAAASFGCKDSLGAHLLDYSYCPFAIAGDGLTGRQDVAGVTSGPTPTVVTPDTIAVRVIYQNTTITGFHVGGPTFYEDAQARIEPTAYAN